MGNGLNHFELIVDAALLVAFIHWKIDLLHGRRGEYVASLVGANTGVTFHPLELHLMLRAQRQ